MLQEANYLFYNSILFRFSKIWKTVVKDLNFNNSKIVINELESLLKHSGNLTAIEKLEIICEWGKGLDWNYDRTQLHKYVFKISETDIFGVSLTVDAVYKLAENFKGTFDIVIPSSLLFKIALPSHKLNCALKPEAVTPNLFTGHSDKKVEIPFLFRGGGRDGRGGGRGGRGGGRGGNGYEHSSEA